VPTRALVGVALVISAPLVAWVATLDAGLAAAVSVVSVTVGAIRWFDRRFAFSFGQGFVGYRPDGWPQGVQEDDDVRWDWKGRGIHAR
jgi:hypothetical protein